MADLTKKLGHAKGAKPAKATTSASSKQVPPTSQLSKETTAVCTELIHGAMSQVLKAQLFG
ncbi:hypothetical protein H4R35_004930 [Dimargaris xerosporica]|nr:hypothetical protein H4R35_004930 [Dimargaris xerosporica]